MVISPVVLAFLATVAAILALKPVARSFSWLVPDGSHAVQGFAPPVVGGIALWCAVAMARIWPPSGEALPQALLGLLAVRLLVPANDGRPWGPWVVVAADTLVCAAIVQQIEGGLAGTQAWVQVAAGVSLLHGIHRLRDLDGLAAVVMGIALAALAGLTTGTAHWLASSGAAAVAALLLFNLPSRLNRSWRVQLGQGGGGHVGLVFLVAGRLAMDSPGSESVTPLTLLWLLPLPTCELLRMMAGKQQPAHQRLLDAGFSVVALFLLYAVVSLVPALVAVILRPSPEVMLPVFAALVALWFVVLYHAPRLMWLLPWQLRRIDVPPRIS